LTRNDGTKKSFVDKDSVRNRSTVANRPKKRNNENSRPKRNDVASERRKKNDENGSVRSVDVKRRKNDAVSRKRLKKTSDASEKRMLGDSRKKRNSADWTLNSRRKSGAESGRRNSEHVISSSKRNRRNARQNWRHVQQQTHKSFSPTDVPFTTHGTSTLTQTKARHILSSTLLLLRMTGRSQVKVIDTERMR
jgi:hypothetical protein